MIPEYDLKSLVHEMMETDLKIMKKYQYLRVGGYTTNSFY